MERSSHSISPSRSLQPYRLYGSLTLRGCVYFARQRTLIERLGIAFPILQYVHSNFVSTFDVWHCRRHKVCRTPPRPSLMAKDSGVPVFYDSRLAGYPRYSVMAGWLLRGMSTPLQHSSSLLE